MAPLRRRRQIARQDGWSGRFGRPEIGEDGFGGNCEDGMTRQMQCMEVWGGNRRVDQHFPLPGVDIWLHSQPVDNAANGGDVHYLSSCASGRITRLLIADVSGHGPEVSQLALQLRDLMRKNINRISQSRFAAAMNEQFIHFNQEDRFATALVGTVFASTGALQLCTAGHPQPLIYRAATGAWGVLETDQGAPTASNMPFGVMTGVDYGQVRLHFGPGDMLLAYTDGLTESRSAGGELLTTEGLLDLVRALDPSRPNELLASLVARVKERTLGPSTDDLTVLLARGNDVRCSLFDNLLAPFRLLGRARDSTRFREYADPRGALEGRAPIVDPPKVAG